MKRAFVVRLNPDCDAGSRRLEGWVEEVDSSKGLRFRSGDELIAFLLERFDAMSSAGGESQSETGGAT
jgi:hypothetical protein